MRSIKKYESNDIAMVEATTRGGVGLQSLYLLAAADNTIMGQCQRYKEYEIFPIPAMRGLENMLLIAVAPE
jgi:hypothetical protein